MQRSAARQLELRLAKPTAAERKALIRDRLAGYGFRQAAREAKRRQAARRREEGSGPGATSGRSRLDGEQLTLPHFPSQRLSER